LLCIVFLIVFLEARNNVFPEAQQNG